LPYAPHLAEEIWQRALGREGSVALQTWPTADADFLHDETWTLVLQVKGKKRGELELGSDVDAGDRETIEKLALAHEGIAKFLVDEAGNAKAPRRVIYVPGKLVNVVP
jgi:leucyl-tRNA synthetase